MQSIPVGLAARINKFQCVNQERLVAGLGLLSMSSTGGRIHEVHIPVLT